MNIVYKRKTSFKARVIVCFALIFAACIALLCGLSLTDKQSLASTKQAEAQVYDEGVKYFNTYGVGETIPIRKIEAKRDSENLAVFAYLQKDKQVVAELTPNDTLVNYVFDQKGKYELVYFVENEDLSNEVIRSYSFTVNKQPYFKADFAPSYIVGSVIDVDKKCFYDLESAKSTVLVTTPKGETKSVVGSFCATEAGFYQVKFTSEIAGLTFSRTYLLDIRKKPTSYTEYFQPITGVSEIRADVSAPAYAKPGTGVAIYSNELECVFQYGNIIDLNALTKNDQLISMLPLVEGDVTPMSTFSVKLIDIYDSSNVIEYHIFSDYNSALVDKEWTYASIVYKGANYGIRTDGSKVKSRFGVDMSVHIRADVLEKDHRYGLGYGKAEWFCAQTDYANKCFHVNAGLGYNTRYSHLLMDLSDSEHVGFGNEWEGFTTGEVYLQVVMKNSYGKCGMIVSEVAGESMSGELSSGRMPAGFFLDSEEKGKAPNGMVGLNYRVPDVSHYVDALEGRVDAPTYSAKLYKEIVSPILMEELPLEAGTNSQYSFVPTEEGQYRLVYTLNDKTGNAFSREFTFTVEAQNSPSLEIEIPEELNVGTYFTVPKLEVQNMSRLTYEKESIVYDGIEYAGKAGEKVLLNKATEIKVRCLYKDYLGQELKVEKVYEVLESERPILSIDGNVPKYVLKGQTIVLPDFSSITYKDGTAVENKSDRKITVEGKDVDLTSRKVKMTKGHGETVKVVYSSLGASQEFAIKVIEANYLSDRFYAASGEFTAVENNKNYVQLTFDEDVRADFIHVIPLRTNENFNFKFALPECNFDYADIRFTDFVDSSKELFIRLTKEKGALYAQLNGLGNKVVLQSDPENGLEYNITYDSAYGSFSPLFTINEYSNGYAFDAFPSDMFYISFDFVGVSEKSSVRILEIDGNKLASFYNSKNQLEKYDDYGTPSLIRTKSIYDTALTYGTVVSVPKILATSIFSGFTWAEITVISPSGKILLNGANAYNENDIVLEEYGAYTISYELGYLLTSSQIITEAFHVRKDAAVEISFKENVEQTFKVGDSLSIPELNIVGMEEDCKTKIYLIAPDYTMREVKEKEKLTFNRRGTYKLSVVTSDKFNIHSRVFEIHVEG